MKKLLFIILFLFLVSIKVEAADINWAADASSSKSGSTTGTVHNNPSYSFDENENTPYGSDSNFVDCITLVESDFAITVTITELKLSYFTLNVGSYAIETYYSGGWHTAASGSTVNGVKTTIDFADLNLLGVSKVKATVSDPLTEWSDSDIYEFYAYGHTAGGSYVFMM